MFEVARVNRDLSILLTSFTPHSMYRCACTGHHTILEVASLIIMTRAVQTRVEQICLMEKMKLDDYILYVTSCIVKFFLLRATNVFTRKFSGNIH